MAWSTPITFTAGSVLTAAQLNTNLRDNLNETAAATAAAAGDVVYADAANSMGSVLTHPGTSRMLVSDASNALVWRQPAEDVNYSDGTTSQFDTDTTYQSTWGADAPSFPSVTVTTGTAALVIVSAFATSNDTAGETTRLSFSISGASSSPANSNKASVHESGNAGDAGSITSVRLVPLTAGSNTFQMEARVSGGTGTITEPRILVIPL